MAALDLCIPEWDFTRSSMILEHCALRGSCTMRSAKTVDFGEKFVFPMKVRLNKVSAESPPNILSHSSPLL